MMTKSKILLRLLTLLLLLLAGANKSWGQDTTIADIDFSNPITNGVVAGRINSMTIGTHANNPTTISYDGRLVLGQTDNTVVIPEQQRDGSLVRLTFDFAFGKLVNRYVNFHLKDAVGNDIAYFEYQPYYNLLNTNLGISSSDLPANDKNSPDWTNRGVTFTITLNYGSNQITTRTSVSNTDRMVSMSNTNALAAFVVGSTYNNADRYSQFDNLLIKSNTNYFSYSVKARVASNFHSTIATGTAANGSTVYVPYHEFIQIGNNLYATSATNQQYRKPVTLNSSNGIEVFVDYSLNQQNVLFFSEAEDLTGGTPSAGGNAEVRCSYALGAFFPQDLVVSNLNAGIYRIWGQIQGNSGTTFSITAGGSSVWSCDTKGYLTSSGNNFTLTNPSDVVIKAMGDNNHVIDCFYLQAIFAFQETGATYTIDETPNISSRLINTTGQTVTYSPSPAADDPVLAVASDGTLTLKRTGRKVITATVTVGDITYTAKYLITVRSTTNASGALTYNEGTHTETFTITGTGNFDVEHFEGERISFDVGNPNEVQQVNGDGLYCIADNGMIYANLQGDIPVSGTYFKFTPKASGVLSVTGIPTNNNLKLADGEGNVLETLTGSGEATYTFVTQLQPNQTYYVYSQDGWWAFFLKSFTFNASQSDATTINVSDLLYATVDGGINSANNKLDRFIPGFALFFSGADGATAYSSSGITFHQNASGVGQLDITPRLVAGYEEGDIVFTGVTLNYSAIEAGKATSALVNGQTAYMPAGSTSASITLNDEAPRLTIRYGSESDDNSFVLQSLTLNYKVTGRDLIDEVIDMSKTSTQLSFDKSVYYVSYGHPGGQRAKFSEPFGMQGYSYGSGFGGTISYSSDNTSIATVASNGTVTIVDNNGSETTIRAQFMGTNYFLPSPVASYTVKSSADLTVENYVITNVRRGMVVEAVISSAGESVLSFSNTIATSQVTNGSEGQLISTYAFDNGGSDATFNVVISYVSGANAYVQSARAYYKTPELKLSYTPQAVYNHHGNWTDYTLQTRFASNTDVATCFDVEGVPTFSAYYNGEDCSDDFVAPSASSVFSKTGNIEWVTYPLTTPKATIRSTGSGSTITDATVSTTVSLRPTVLGYDPNAANNVAAAQLPVIPFPYTWNLTTGSFADKTKALQLEGITDDGNGYVLLGPGSVMVETTGNMGKKAYNYYIDETLPNSKLRIPVMQGMKVSVTCHGAQQRVTGNGYPLQISNVTDLRGYATATLEIKTTSNTQEFIAKDNGYVEIFNRSDVNVYITSITVSAPELVFEDGTSPKTSKTATYQNHVVNKPTQATLTFSDNDPYNAKIASRNNGTYTFQSSATGDIVVTATTTGAHGIEPCWGQYTLSLVNFYFDPSTIYLTHSSSSVSYPTNIFLSNAHLYLDGKDWLNMTAAEKAKIGFSVASPAYIDVNQTNPNFATGIVKNNNDVNNPYTMEIRNDGKLIITAFYTENNSTVKTTCTVNITMTAFAGFKYSAPTVASDESSYTFADDNSRNPLNSATRSAVTSYRCTYIGKEGSQFRTETNLGLNTTLTLDRPGVYRVEALDNSTTLAEFYLTKAYPVNQSTSQSWDFRNGVSSEWGTSWAQLKDPTTGNNVAEGTPGAVPYFEYADYRWTRGMPTNRASDYRCVHAVNGNNGFIVKETSGLVIIADAPTCSRDIIDGLHCDGHFSAYTGNRYNYVYPNIGLHRSTLIIPHLPKGAYVAVAWDRTSEGDGNTIVMENLLDLEGRTIDEIKYGGSVRLTGANAGNQQGYYTFRVANDGNVTFTQNDKGTSRIVAIHVYYGNPDTNVHASDDMWYNRNAVEEYKGSGMTQRLMAYARSNADGSADVGSGLMSLDGILTSDGKTTSQWLTNYLNFNAPNGVAEFNMVNQDVTLHNMTMDMSQTYFDSGNGRYAIPGLSFNGACWGKAVMSVGVRDGNGYLVAYRQYRFTVGIKPFMEYPKTWDFTRYFDNKSVKIEDSPVTVLPETVNLNTKASLAINSGYDENTESMDVLDTEPTRTWDDKANNYNFSLKRKSGDETYHQYGYNEYSSYYVDDAMLVCNMGERNDDGFIIEETRGLGFSIAESGNSLQWEMPTGNVGYGENSCLHFSGTMTIAGVGDDYNGYYVFVKSSKAPDACSENLKSVTRGDYKSIASANEGQYVFEVNSDEDMTMTFNSLTDIYGIAVTNIKKEAVHPVGTIGWATESRDVDIDHTLTGYYTRHNLRAYEVLYDSYDMNTATVRLTEVKNTNSQTYDSNTQIIDHGYVAKGNGIVLAEFNVAEPDTYASPLFVPAITTTHEATISGNNMMRPNLVRRQFGSEEEGTGTRFLLTNVHWTFTKGGNLTEEELEGAKITETDAAGFYRQHVWSGLSAAENAAKNTMVPNTAYLLVPTSELPVAVWNNPVSPSRVVNTIAIRFDDATGIKDINAPHDDNKENGRQCWYTLNGTMLSATPTKPGIYIKNGRKVVIK